MSIGEAARKAREAAGFSMQELAEKSGYTYANIRNIEKNIVSPKIDTVVDMADTLGISIYEYIGMKPKIDVVEVVRCKDCEYYEPKNSLGTQGICMCGEKEMNYAGEFYPYENDFCSYGMKKEGAEE